MRFSRRWDARSVQPLPPRAAAASPTPKQTHSAPLRSLWRILRRCPNTFYSALRQTNQSFILVPCAPFKSQRLHHVYLYSPTLFHKNLWFLGGNYSSSLNYAAKDIDIYLELTVYLVSILGSPCLWRSSIITRILQKKKLRKQNTNLPPRMSLFTMEQGLELWRNKFSARLLAADLPRLQRRLEEKLDCL